MKMMYRPLLLAALYEEVGHGLIVLLPEDADARDAAEAVAQGTDIEELPAIVDMAAALAAAFALPSFRSRRTRRRRRSRSRSSTTSPRRPRS